MERTLHRLKLALLEELVSQAENGMLYPKADPFDHGVQAGRYQGVKQALDILDKIDLDQEEAEARL